MKQLVERIFESMHLKQVRHEGWRLAGVQHPDSVAEHSLIATQIGYFLALMEWVDPAQVVITLLFHDLPETRIGDLHRIATRYIEWKDEAEKNVLEDQLDWLPGKDKIWELVRAFEEKRGDVARVAKDADYLEQAFQAKIYEEQGYAMAKNRIENVWRALQTASAKQLREAMQQWHSTDRRAEQGLKKLS